MVLLCAAALAGSFFLDIGEDRALAVGGTWARAFPDGEDAWHFFWAAGGDYNRLPMSDDLVVEDYDRRPLSGHTDLIDSQIVPCPDGTWLHVGSSGVTKPDDTAYAFRYDADFNPLSEAMLEYGDTSMRMNDPSLLCEGGDLDLVGVVTRDFQSTVYVLDAAGNPAEQVTVATWPMLQGGALAWDQERDEILAIGYDLDRLVAVMRAGRDFSDIDEIQLPLTVGAETPYWPQGLMRIGAYWLVAHMARDESAGWANDEGNVRLAVFDSDWNLLETQALTTYSPPNGAMRPGIARRGDRLLVTYDILLVPHVVPVTLDLVAFGLEEGSSDTGGQTGGDTDDTGGPPEPAPPEDEPEVDAREPYTPASACGCASGPGVVRPAAALFGLAVLRRRRR